MNLSSYHLKMIAIIAMAIDHIAWAFVPTESALGIVMHVIGRLTAPIMSYFIAEGFYYTHNLKKYIIRMAIFAAVSHFAFSYYETGTFTNTETTSVIYTLLLGLLALSVWYSSKLTIGYKVLLIVLLCVFAMYGDWWFLTVLWTLFFGVFRGNKKKQFISFGVVGLVVWLIPLLYSLNYNPAHWYRNLFQLGIYLAIPLLYKYNGSLGGNKNMKWLFYIFYPAHLFVIGIIAWVIV